MTNEEIKIIVIIAFILIFIMSFEGIICYAIGETKGWLRGIADGKMFYAENDNDDNDKESDVESEDEE